MTISDIARRIGPAGYGVPPNIIALDICERIVVALVFARFAIGMLTHFQATPNVRTLLLVFSETLPFVYVMARRWSANLSRDPLDWTFGILGTVSPLLVVPASGAAPLLPFAICVGVMTFGLCLQVSGKLVLGRSFGIIPANRGIKVAGPYRFLRHPIYAGYTLTHIGYLLAMPALSTAVLYTLALSFQVVRIFREERLLKQDADYRLFAARVRWRLLPGVF